MSEDILDKNKDLLAIILHGFRAKGDFRQDSDHDFLFITRRGKSYSLQSKYQNAFEQTTKELRGFVIELLTKVSNCYKKLTLQKTNKQGEHN